VALPKELRKTMDIDVKALNVKIKVLYKDKYVCKPCIEKMEHL